MEEDDGVVVADGGRFLTVAARIDDDGGHDKFVTATRRVGGVLVIMLEGFGGGGVFFALVLGEEFVGGLHALPAVVAVHGVEAADDGGNSSDADGFAFGFEGGEEGWGAKASGRVAAVGDGVDENPVSWGSFVGLAIWRRA